MNFITGEKFQMLCDHFLGTQTNLNYNPLIKNFRNKWIDIEYFNKHFNNKSLIFCYSDLTMVRHINLIEKLKLFENPFILILHNSDISFDQKWLDEALSISNLIKIYAENMNVLHEKVIPIPIGIANSMWSYGKWSHGDSHLFNEIMNKYEIIKKDAHKDFKNKFVYFCFSINTNIIKRQECLVKITRKGFVFTEFLEVKDYLDELVKHRYAICPAGNGFDTHRLWECLYLKVIPICTRSILTEYFSKYFPIIILNDWDDLDTNNLIENYDKYNNWDNYDKLNFNYYSNMIMSDTKRIGL